MCIADRPMTFEQSLSRTAELLEAAAERAIPVDVKHPRRLALAVF